MINLILLAFEKNWTLERRSSPNYFKPLRASEHDGNIKSPDCKCRFTYNGEQKEETFRIVLPLIMAMAMADLLGCSKEEIKSRFSIDGDDEFNYKMAASEGVMQSALSGKAARDRVDSVFELTGQDLEHYRVYLKWQLCLNYINLHQEQYKEFVKIKMEW